MSITSREMTQEEVADRSGVHAMEVSRIEAGKRDRGCRRWNPSVDSEAILMDP